MVLNDNDEDDASLTRFLNSLYKFIYSIVLLPVLSVL